MDRITVEAIRAKHETPRCVCAIVVRDGVVITSRISPALRLVRDDGLPPRVDPPREQRASIDGPSPQRVAEWPKGAA
jgi:hypothetical protein